MTAPMELPIFNDNLRSSGSWTDALEQARAQWNPASDQVRDYQIAQLRQTSAGQLTDDALTKATTLVSAWASEPDAKFTLDRLLTLHRTLIAAPADADVLRKTEPPPINALHDPTPAVLLPRMIEHAFDWFSTEGFAELHPVEQAAVVYLRLLDMHPFKTATEPTALLTAGFYTERAGLPPLVISADDITQARFAQALEAAFRMLTQPLVELFAESLRATMKLSGQLSTDDIQ